MQLWKKSVFRKNELSFGDILNYGVMIEDGILLGKDGTISAGYYYTGEDFDSADNSELNDLTARLNSTFSRLGSEYAVHFNAIRRECSNYPNRESSHFTSLATMLIDEERRQSFKTKGRHYETIFAFTITYLPETAQKAKLVDWIVSDGSKEAANQSLADKNILSFKYTLEELELRLASVFNLRRMKSYVYKFENIKETRDEFLEYINYCLTGFHNPITLSNQDSFLDILIGGHELITDPTLKIDDKYIKIITIDELPFSSRAGMLEQLDKLDCEYRWCNRFVFLDLIHAKAELNKYKKAWEQKIRGFFDQITSKHNGAINQDAANMVADAENAISEAETGIVKYGFYTSVIVIFNEDLDVLNLNVKDIRRAINDRAGFNARVESLNALEAYLGSLPTHVDQNIRRPLINTANFAQIMPSSAIWVGSSTAPCPLYPLNSPALMYVRTSGSTPFRLNFHESDVGHTLMVGVTGAGKSTLLATIAAQFNKYENSSVFVFDKGLSMKALATFADGSHYSIFDGNEESLNFAPLDKIQNQNDFLWCLDWLTSIVELNGYKLTIDQTTKLNLALRQVANMDGTEGQERTIGSLITKLQDQQLKDIFSQYAEGGAFDEILNQPHENFKMGQLVVFEIEHVLRLKDVIKLPILLYLFRVIERSLEGQPTLIIIDEAWSFLKNQIGQEKIIEWLKVFRKANAAVLLATQTITDIKTNSSLSTELGEACVTKIFLANPEVQNEVTYNAYKSLGCTDAEIKKIRYLTKKQEYFIKTGNKKRSINMDLGRLTLSLVGASSKNDLKMLAQMPKDVDVNENLIDWFEKHGINENYYLPLMEKIETQHKKEDLS